jgi:hypothetical protein
MPNVRSYWSASLGYRQISDVMSKNESERIRRFLHFADNTKMPERNDANYDKLYKLRPVIDALNSKSQSTKARLSNIYQPSHITGATNCMFFVGQMFFT